MKDINLQKSNRIKRLNHFTISLLIIQTYPLVIVIYLLFTKYGDRLDATEQFYKDSTLWIIK